MWRNYSVLLAIVSLSVSPALADLVGVTVSGSVAFSGSAIARCEGLPDPYCPNPGQGFDQESLNFNGTNTNQDNFNASDSVTVDGRVTLSTSAQQITGVSADSFSVDLQEIVTLDAFGAEWGAGDNGSSPLISNSYLLDFTLTTESEVQLSEPLCLLNNSFSSCFQGGSSFYQLGPGTYSLSLQDDLYATFAPDSYGCIPPVCDLTASNELSLTADFTPIVPEPRWSTFFPLAVIMAAAACLRRRKEV